jgi:hypothetical protein
MTVYEKPLMARNWQWRLKGMPHVCYDSERMEASSGYCAIYCFSLASLVQFQPSYHMLHLLHIEHFRRRRHHIMQPAFPCFHPWPTSHQRVVSASPPRPICLAIVVDLGGIGSHVMQHGSSALDTLRVSICPRQDPADCLTSPLSNIEMNARF